MPFIGQLGATASGITRMATVFMGLRIPRDRALGVVDIYEDLRMAQVAVIGILLGSKGYVA
jgi:hypothetical protein